MVLDFGSFVLDSDASAAADLPAEEAALYMGFKLSARNISAFLVDGDFGWALLTKFEAHSKLPGEPAVPLGTVDVHKVDTNSPPLGVTGVMTRMPYLDPTVSLVPAVTALSSPSQYPAIRSRLVPCLHA